MCDLSISVSDRNSTGDGNVTGFGVAYSYHFPVVSW